MKQPIFHKLQYNFQTGMVDFSVVLGQHTFEYHVGIGHVPKSDTHKLRTRLNWIEAGYGLEMWERIQRGNVSPTKNSGVPIVQKVMATVAEFVKPEADGFLHSLLLDARCGQELFEDFCDNCGYDSDSRKAFATYEACQQIAKKLREIFTPEEMAELEKRLEDF